MYFFSVLEKSSWSKQLYLAFNRKPTYFPEMRWTYMIKKFELQTKMYAPAFRNLQFVFQSGRQYHLLRWYYITIFKTNNSNTAFLRHENWLRVNLFENFTSHWARIRIPSEIFYRAVFESNFCMIYSILAAFFFRKKTVVVLFSSKSIDNLWST